MRDCDVAVGVCDGRIRDQKIEAVHVEQVERLREVESTRCLAKCL